jgi:hypothetical protein
MKQLLKLAAVAWVLCGLSGAARAYTLDFLLLKDVGTWTLHGRTDAPGGIAAFVVDLQGVSSGVSDAPRGTFGGGPVNGFTLGNVFAAQQAFAGQNTSNAASVVYGLGKYDVPDSAFGAPVPFTMVGSGIRMEPGVLGGGWVKLYHGTNTSSFSATYKLQQPQAFGSVFATVGSPTTVGQVFGPGINLNVNYYPDPEPSSCILAALTVPALIYAARRRRNASNQTAISGTSPPSSLRCQSCSSY